MEIIDWQGSRNTLRQAMEESAENALGISSYTCNALAARKLDPNPGFGLLYTETNAIHSSLLVAMGIKQGSDSTKTANTKNVDNIFNGMGEKLNLFDDKIRAVYGKNTFAYKAIWGKNRNRFYRGSFEQRESAVKGLAVAMEPYTDLNAVAAEVMAYYNHLIDSRAAQQGKISGSKSFSTEVFVIIERMILQMDRNVGWLKYNFALDPNAQATVNTFFDLSRIINHKNYKIYTRHVPIAGKVKVCRHLFKATDKIKITVDGTEDVLISLVYDGKLPLHSSSSYRAVAGTTIIKPALEIFPDLTYRQVMGLNSSSSNASHLVFQIIEA